MKAGYKPIPYPQRDVHGKIVKTKDRAVGAAQYFANTVWGRNSERVEPDFTSPRLVEQNDVDEIYS